MKSAQQAFDTPMGTGKMAAITTNNGNTLRTLPSRIHILMFDHSLPYCFCHFSLTRL